MNSPKISVIIPVYNVEKYLQTCIDSLLSQSMKEIEFIFVNDASPDGSLAILQENQRLHPDQIRIIDSKVNQARRRKKFRHCSCPSASYWLFG